MDQPPAGLAIQGLLGPAFVEEHSVIPKQISDSPSSDHDTDQIVKMEGHEEETIYINGHKHEDGSTKEGLHWEEELEDDETSESGTSFYKLEMVKIQLISAHGHQVSHWGFLGAVLQFLYFHSIHIHLIWPCHTICGFLTR